MVEVVGVRFETSGKIYYFSPASKKFEVGEKVIVETVRGVEFGEIVLENREIVDDNVVQTLKPVIRKATEQDEKTNQQNRQKEIDAEKICNEKILQHKLDMKLINVEYTFDGGKILFYFTTEGRVDFRELVKDLASVFRTRIELRQIGVRDEARMLGGLGVCGRKLCCSSFLGDFMPVSIKMAKEQNLSLNPTKISGNCGRLMCCLKYENDVYEEVIKRLPKPGSLVKTPEGKGVVISIDALKEMIFIKLETDIYKKFDAGSVTVLKSASFKNDDSPEDLKQLEGK